MTRLSDALNEANERGLSAREIANAAKPPISHTTVARFLAGTHGRRPSDDSLKSLASVLKISVMELRQLADLPAGENRPYVPPAEASQLNDRQREAVNELIRSIVERRHAPKPQPVAEPTINPGDSKADYDLANYQDESADPVQRARHQQDGIPSQATPDDWEPA